MEISLSDWMKYKNKLSAISTKASDELVAWLQTKGGYQSVDKEDLISYAYALATKYGEATASLSAQMYDEVAEASGATVPSAEVANTVSYSEMTKAINGVTKTQTTNKNIGNVVSRYTKRAAEDTTLNNAERDGAQFAWVPMGDTCVFCLTLASRGWQYMSKSARKNGHASHIHANCDCTYAVRFSEDDDVEGYDPKVYQNMYYSAEGSTPSEKINSMRRIQYQANKDKINAQKRANYKEKKNAELENEESRKKEKALNQDTRINKDAYSEKELRAFTDSLNESTNTSREIYKRAKEMLEHRDGTLYEDLAYINTTKKESLINKDFDFYDEATGTSGCKPSKAMNKMLKKSEPETIIGIHNHPRSYAPSDSDIEKANERRYKYGIVFCHDGKKYKYHVSEDYDAFNTHFVLENLEKAVYDNDTDKINTYIEDLKKLGVDMEVYQ